MSDAGFRWRRAEPVALTEDHIMSVLLVRSARKDVLGENLFSDPAWDILLELFGAKLGSRAITVSDLSTAIGIPMSTTRRWLTTLGEAGLLITRDQLVELSAEGLTRMERLAGRWASAFLAIA